MESALVTFDRFLSVAGVRFFDKNQWNSKYWKAFQITNFVITVLALISCIGFLVENISNLAIAIQGACICFSGFVVTLSLGLFLIYGKNFRLFINEMVFNDSMMDIPFIRFILKNSTGKTLKELKVIVEESHVKIVKYSSYLLVTMFTSICVVITLYEAESVYRIIVREDKSLRLLVFDMWCPLSLENYYIYVGFLISQFYLGYLCCIAYSGLVSILFVLIGQIIRQLRILIFVFLNLDSIALEIIGERNDKWQQLATHIMSQCFEQYLKIKRFSNKVNVIYQPIYLTFILDGSVLVCVCSVKIATSDKFAPDTMKYYMHEICFITMVLMFCLIGQQVNNECEILNNALTEKWYIYDKKHLTHLKIAEMALSEKIPIHIFGSNTLSLPIFTWFIRNAMSVFTLVMSVLEE